MPHMPAMPSTLCCCTQPHSPNYHRQFTSESQADVAESQIGYKGMLLVTIWG